MKRDDIHGIEDRHPSYGMIRFARVCSHGQALVGSSILHAQTVRVEIKTARWNRNYNQDRFFEDRHIIEVEMSPVQFAEAITSMNTTGVPCTLRWTREDGDIPRPELDHERDRVAKEFSKDVQHVAKELDEIVDFVNRLADQPSVKKADIKTLKDMVRQARQDISSDLPFVAEQFNETVEKTVAHAKGEFEAYVLHRALYLANPSFVDVDKELEGEIKPPMLALEGPNETL